MSMKDWAKREIEIACKKRENLNWDGESFDYGCSCYASAYKAYECLMNDDHSGFSFGITKYILKRLLDGLPLSPITDEDFDGVEPFSYPNEDNKDKSSVYLVKEVQCPRKSSLFKEFYSDGSVAYHDNDRYFCRNVECYDDTFRGGGVGKFINKMFPISMPYSGEGKPYEVGVLSFLCDKKNGDFDHQGIVYVKKPDGTIIDIDNEYKKEVNGKWVKCTKEEFYKDYEKRLSKISNICIGYTINEYFSKYYDKYIESIAEEYSQNYYTNFYKTYNIPSLIERFEKCYKEKIDNLNLEKNFEIFDYLNQYTYDVCRDITDNKMPMTEVIEFFKKHTRINKPIDWDLVESRFNDIRNSFNEIEKDVDSFFVSVREEIINTFEK